MRLCRVIAALVMLPMAALAQAPEGPGSTILVLDASGSMWGQIDGTAKISIAQTVIGDLLESLPLEQALGLTAYGHRTKGDCTDIETLVVPGDSTRDGIAAAVNAIQPRGKTPMTDAVVAAADALRYTEEKATVILVSDGIETCHPDPCAAARALEEAGVDFTVHVIGFDVADPAALAQMQCLADETGGRFLSAANAAELGSALDAVTQVVEVVPMPVTLRATAGENGPEIDAPLIWEVTLDGTPVVAFERAAGLVRDLAPGEYVASVVRPGDEASAQARFSVAKEALTVTLVLPVPLPPARIDGPDSVVAGSTALVTWEGPDGKDDYVSVAVPDKTDYENYTYTREGSPAPLLMPPVPGTYELRYVMADGRTVLARKPILVTEAAASVTAPDSAPAGATIPVAWEGPDYANDYIAVATPGEEDYVNYVYTREGSPAQLVLPARPGDYEVRYVIHQDRTVIARRDIEVTEVSASIDAPSSAVAGESLKLSWTGPNYANDYLSIAKPGDDGYDTYSYTRDGMPLALRAPLETGTYELRYVMNQDRTVLAAYPLEVVAVGAELRLPDSARAGAPVVVDWSGPGYESDFISVGRVEDEGYDSYTYTREGSPLIVDMPVAPGTYEVRYVAQGDGKAVLARRNITLEPVTATIEAAATGVAGGKLAVSWDGPDYRNDFIGIVGKGAPEGEYLTYVYTRDDSPVILDLPEVPGSYELRYHLGEGKSVIGVRAIEVVAE